MLTLTLIQAGDHEKGTEAHRELRRLKLARHRSQLDEGVERNLNAGDLVRGDGHEVPVDDTEDGLMCHDADAVLLPLDLDDDGLEALDYIQVGLACMCGWVTT